MIENKEIEDSRANKAHKPYKLEGTIIPDKNISNRIPIVEDPVDNLLYNINRYALLVIN